MEYLTPKFEARIWTYGPYLLNSQASSDLKNRNDPNILIILCEANSLELIGLKSLLEKRQATPKQITKHFPRFKLV